MAGTLFQDFKSLRCTSYKDMENGVSVIAVSPDARYIAVALLDSTVKVSYYCYYYYYWSWKLSREKGCNNLYDKMSFRKKKMERKNKIK